MTAETSPPPLPVANGHDPASSLLAPDEKKAKKNARSRAHYTLNKEQILAKRAAKAAYKREWYLANLERIRAKQTSPEARAKKNEARNSKRRNDPEYVERERAQGRANYARHREPRIQKAREYYERTKPARNEAQKKYYQAHKGDFARRRDEWVAKNPEKKRKSAYDWLERNREQVRGQRITRFGLTYEAYLEILNEQHGLCAICKNPEQMTVKKTGRVQYLCVDHDHSTGKIRGLLCGRCNIAIGMLGDDPATIFAAWEYLTKHKDEER